MRRARTLFVAVLVAACGDPVRDRRMDALGPEAPGIAIGPLHRPGQPCLACHDGKGEARAMSVAGTVFRTEDDAQPVFGVDVILTDAERRTFATKTNCAGNF